MAKHVHRDIIVEYQFLKKKVKKLILKAQNLGSIQQKRWIKKIANLLRQMNTIEKDCKAMELPHPDSFDNEEPTLVQMQDMVFGGPKIRSATGPDGCLYSKGRDSNPEVDSQILEKTLMKLGPDGCLYGKDTTISKIDSQTVSDKILVKLNPDGSLFDKNGAFKDAEGQIQKMVAKSNPDGSLFETPALEGSVLPRKSEG